MIVIVDYGLGNLQSIQNMFKRIGVDSIISADQEDIKKAGKLILPGVGKFDAGMHGIEIKNLHEILNEKVLLEKTPVLGICLGMQLMTKSSAEGTVEGLGWIDAVTKKFEANKCLKIPHMGWNNVEIVRSTKLTKNFDDKFKFYFVHSYYVEPMLQEDTILSTEYGFGFTSAFQHENIYGVQFHPEKSHKYGMQLMRNFAEI